MLVLSATFVIMAIILFIVAGYQKRKVGFPDGRIIYSDTQKWGRVEKPLYDHVLRLTGKPDYLVKKDQMVIPIEVKSRRAPRQPKEWHIYQLAAYCLLIESVYKIRPKYGIINYQDKSFAVDFTEKLEESTQEIIHEMQSRASQLQVDRSHDDQERCIHCGFKSVCNQALRI
jgi:CRISPR-associated exonuclease Cas4